MKEKYFTQDIQSSIAKGNLLNKTDFLKEKENLMKKKGNKTNKTEEIKTYRNQNSANKEINKNEKNKTTQGFFFKDPNDYTKKLLKGNTFFFEQNNTQMIKPKQWKFGVKR